MECTVESRICALEWLMAAVCGLSAAMLMCWLHGERKAVRMDGRMAGMEIECSESIRRLDDLEYRLDRIEARTRRAEGGTEQ